MKISTCIENQKKYTSNWLYDKIIPKSIDDDQLQNSNTTNSVTG